MAIIYTPAEEHFGIVPIESMDMGKPVVACNSGGPCETIVSGETGYLCVPLPNVFAEALYKLVTDEHHAKELGTAAKRRVNQLFSFDTFAEDLNKYLFSLLEE